MGMAPRPVRQWRHAAVPRDAEPRPVHGPARLSAAPRRRRDGGRRRAAGRPPASARSLHGAVRQAIRTGWPTRTACSSMPACPASPPSARPPSCTGPRPRRPKRRSPITGSTRRTSPSAWSRPAWSGDFKLEASRFHGREPDQDRYDIETGRSIRPRCVCPGTRPKLSLQASWADVTSPEQLEPDETRHAGRRARSTRGPRATANSPSPAPRPARIAATASRSTPGSPRRHVRRSRLARFFSRAEAIETDELGPIHHGPIEDVAKLSIGVSLAFGLIDNRQLSIGALVSTTGSAHALAPLYDGDPTGAMVFVRLKVG